MKTRDQKRAERRAKTRAANLAVTTILRQLKEDGVTFQQSRPKRHIVLAAAERHWSLPNSEDLSRKQQSSRLIEIASERGLMKRPKVKTPKQAQPAKPKGQPQKKIDAFYASFEWRRARYEVLRRNNGRCELCGRSKHDGIVLHVDHIKPLRFNWSLRLSQSNLQVLCEICNHGKGNTYEDDWRGPRLATVMGERIDECV